MSFLVNTIVNGDCVEGLATIPSGEVDLVFADPPFNIGYEYDRYKRQQGSPSLLGLEQGVD